MIFIKNMETVSIHMKTGLALFETGNKIKIAGIEKLKTIEKIDFLEKKGFKVCT